MDGWTEGSGVEGRSDRLLLQRARHSPPPPPTQRATSRLYASTRKSAPEGDPRQPLAGVGEPRHKLPDGLPHVHRVPCCLLRRVGVEGGQRRAGRVHDGLQRRERLGHFLRGVVEQGVEEGAGGGGGGSAGRGLRLCV